MARQTAHFFVLSTMLAGGVFVANACSSDDGENDDTSASSTSNGAGAGGSANTTTTSQGPGNGGGTTSGGGNGTGGNGTGGNGTGGTAQEVKVAFLGDSGIGAGYLANLNLIQSEGADFVIHEGDFDYSEEPVLFWSAVDNVLGHDYPYLLAVGNHDDGAWVDANPPAPLGYSYTEHMDQHFSANGIVIDDPDHSDEKYATEFMGIQIVVAGQNGNNAEWAQFVDDQLDPNDPGWKVCNWHKNQTAMQAGGKGNEMGWGVYEACRQNGAIIVTGHEHSYSRTKTLTSMENQTVDATCSDPGQLCVGPGRTFAVVQGLGGTGVRDQLRCLPTTYPYGCNQEWAMIYADQQNAQYGIMFITFNAGGDPSSATGYFKTIDGDVIDQFEITKD